MIAHLIVITCLAANDCQVHRHSSYEGENAALRCELVREVLLADIGEQLVKTRLECEVE